MHEHPQGATSWKLESTKKLKENPLVYLSKADTCSFGMVDKDWYKVRRQQFS